MDEEKLIKERKIKVLKFFKKNYSWLFYLGLILLVILGVYIRYLPLTDHNGNPGLWDYTTNDYTLGPDLDPFLFLRYAKTIIENGSLPHTDIMRYSPVGFDTTTELQMVSYMIVITYKLVNLFGDYSVNFAGAFMPVWLFALTILSFFLFVREIFLRKDKMSKIKSNIISLISTLFMIILPGFLPRTVAGIPEKESVAFFFMFLSFYLFLKSWKSETTSFSVLWGILAGITTGLMGLTWGGISYVYISIGLASLVAFILNQLDKKTLASYSSWLIVSTLLILIFSNRTTLSGFLFRFDSGLAFSALAIFLIHKILWNAQVYKKIKIDKIRIPKTLITIIISVLVLLVLGLLFKPAQIVSVIEQINSNLIKPVTGRWNTTVAENRQPYFTEWQSSFGKYFFWLFFSGSVLLFYSFLKEIRKKDKIKLTGAYVLLFIGVVFSRYSEASFLNGENFISKILYFGAILLFLGMWGYYYLTYYKKQDLSFETLDFEHLFLFILFFIAIISSRGAVRVIMILIPIAPILVAYMLVELGDWLKIKSKKSIKILIGVCFIIVLLISVYYVALYYQQINSQSYNYVPGLYNQQWQTAMQWVRENTSADSIFAHWWDYGYWVQSIGNRATVTDGGNAIVWWNYLVGRYVLTGDNQTESLSFLKSHNADYLLVDSSDIGKYGAYSQIGSDENLDRFSSGPITLLSNSAQEQEVRNGKIKYYNTPSGTGVSVYPIEEDLFYEQNGEEIRLAKENSGFFQISIFFEQTNETIKIEQPQLRFLSNSKQISLPLRYVYFKGKFYDFGSGVSAAVYIIPRVYESGSGLAIDETGAVIYVSPRILRGYVGQVYILNDPFGNFKNFELAHSEQNKIIEYLKAQGANIEDFVYYNGLHGPIKIWKINYTGKEETKEEYLTRSPPDYITWKF